MSGRGRSDPKYDNWTSERVTLLPEPNQDGTWGLAAYYQRPDGSADKRILATCERQSDVCHAMRHLWLDIWHPVPTTTELNPAAL